MSAGTPPRFTLHRLWAMVLKEFIQMKRDRVTFAMMVGIPLMQLIMFGYAINGDPKHLPTALVVHEHTTYTRSLTRALVGRASYTIDSRRSVAFETASRSSSGIGAGPPVFTASTNAAISARSPSSTGSRIRDTSSAPSCRIQ